MKTDTIENNISLRVICETIFLHFVAKWYTLFTTLRFLALDKFDYSVKSIQIEMDEDWGEEADRCNRASYNPQLAIEQRMVGSFYAETLKNNMYLLYED